MKSPNFLTLVLVIVGALLTSRVSTASACDTCKLGRGTTDTISNGLLLAGGMGADPMHGGVSLDADDVRAQMTKSATSDAGETAYVFGLNAPVQMKSGLDWTRPTPDNRMPIAPSDSGFGRDRFVVPSFDNSLPFAPTVQSGGIELAVPSDLIIADPQDAGRVNDATTPVPEPASLSMLCLALLGIRRRRGH